MDWYALLVVLKDFYKFKRQIGDGWVEYYIPADQEIPELSKETMEQYFSSVEMNNHLTDRYLGGFTSEKVITGTTIIFYSKR